MTLPVYPDRTVLLGLGFNQKWSPTFFNMPTATTASGADIDLGLAQNPLHDFELTYKFLRDGLSAGPNVNATLEFKTLMGFFLMLGGSLGRFLFLNVDDFQVSRNQIGVGDGTTTVFPLTRTFGASGYYGTEPVGQVIAGASFNAWLGASGTPVSPTLYTVDSSKPVANTVTFGTAPTAGEVVAVDMSYYYYCKFADNAETFEKFMDRLWMLSKITIHSCRPGA